MKTNTIIELALKKFGSNNKIYKDLCNEVAKATNKATLKEVFEHFKTIRQCDLLYFRRWLNTKIKEAEK